jgi:hypothetical protein
MKVFAIGQPLLDENTANGGGGGAAVTMEAVTKLVSDAVKAASVATEQKFTALLKPFEGLGGQLTTLMETVTAEKTAREEAATQAANNGKTKDGKDAIPPELAKQLNDLTKSQTALQKQLADEQGKREKAEQAAKQTARESAVRAELNNYKFANPEAANDAFSLLLPQVEESADGQLIAGGLPLADYVKDYLPSKKAHLLAPAGKGGSGASNTGTGGSSTFQYEEIKPGMSAEQVSRAAAAIREAMPQLR